ncbi:uncharacterized protein C6orf163 homolog [Hypanus sabinus]|uniref:uncharacterized protein C6orf163 homolog n=1 Tax=Hypanus sabinus TaxID=79690 RepID=UPI0028C3C407|nr:uncharacterized protein C6orf163 homolog [Hypanus sabinus]
MDTWCFNIKSRKSLLVTPDGGTRGLPTWYKEPRHSLIQQNAHKCILELGSAIHQQYIEASNIKQEQSLEEARAAVLNRALKEETEAVKNALLVAEQQKNKELELLKNKLIGEIKDEVQKAEAKMQWKHQQQTREEREAGEKRLAQEIQQTIQKCEAEKEKVVQEAIEEQKAIALQNLEEVVLKIKINAEYQKESLVQESLQSQKAEYEKIILQEVAKARQEEKELAEAPIVVLQSRHQSEIDQLKKMLCDKDVNLKDVYERVETMTILELELEMELRETRQAFQDYINLTFPNLPPEQLEFILPSRPMCRDLSNPLRVCKPHKAQSRRQN